ncbi:MAG: transposase [Planctomycetes bacterium]|nr:transposase [Planctomycetota bacterium]
MKSSETTGTIWLQAVLAVARLLANAHAKIAAKAKPRSAEIVALRAGNERLRCETELLRARLERLPSQGRSRYKPWERLRILWHRARYGLSMRETARTFVVRVSTLQAWLRGLGQRPKSCGAKTTRRQRLHQVVAHLVHLLRWKNPAWGTRRIAQILARLGVKVSRRSVQRLVRAKPPRPTPTAPAARKDRARKPSKRRTVRARRPHHVWLVDLTVFKLAFGLIHLRAGAVLDAFARSVIAIDLCPTEPTAAWASRLFSRATRAAGRSPKHLVTDQGPPFTSERFRQTVKTRGTRQRFGAIGCSGSISLIERFWRTLKTDALPFFACLLPQEVLLKRISRWARWYAKERPHQGLDGATPNEEARRRRAPRRVLDLHAHSRWKLERLAFEGDTNLPVYRLRKSA